MHVKGLHLPLQYWHPTEAFGISNNYMLIFRLQLGYKCYSINLLQETETFEIY